MALAVKNPPANSGDVRDMDLIPGWGRSPEGGHGNPLQYSCLENPMDRGPWQATVHGVTKSRTQLNDFTFFLSIFLVIKDGQALHSQQKQDRMLTVAQITNSLLQNSDLN